MTTTVSFPYGKTERTCTLETSELKAVITGSLKDYQAPLSQAELVSHAWRIPSARSAFRRWLSAKRISQSSPAITPAPCPAALQCRFSCQKYGGEIPQRIYPYWLPQEHTGPHPKTNFLNGSGKKLFPAKKYSFMTAMTGSPWQSWAPLQRNAIAINKLAYEADLLIAEGLSNPTSLRAFPAAAKALCRESPPGASIMYNHCAPWIADPHSVMGTLEHNPIHEDMVYAPRNQPCMYSQCSIKPQKEIISAYAGDMIKAHAAGTEFLSNCAAARLFPRILSCVSNGGAPLDQNIYQSVKGMATASRTCRKGGVIIIASQCADGHGGEGFYRTFACEKDTQKIMDSIISRSPEDTVPDQWQSQILCGILLDHPVILVSDAPKKMVEDMHLIPADSIDEAVSLARSILGLPSPSITAVTDGPSVIIK